jgi:hypothetical protein
MWATVATLALRKLLRVHALQVVFGNRTRELASGIVTTTPSREGLGGS